MRVASVVIGTSSVLLLIADQKRLPGGSKHSGRSALQAVHEAATITRLGEGVDATGKLAATPTERTLACLQDYAARARSLGAGVTGAVATSVLRDASGADRFLDRAEAVLAARPHVISGEEEGELTFRGCTADPAVLGITAPEVVVFDVGGGSTEIIAGCPGPPPRIAALLSKDIGSVRLTERYLSGNDDPPGEVQLERVRRAIRAQLGDLSALLRGKPLCGTAGTATTLAALVHRVHPYDAQRIHGAFISQAALRDTISTLAGMPLSERRTLAGLDPLRADIIIAGALLIAELCAMSAGAGFVVSHRGLRWGLAYRLMEQHDHRPDA